jgi:tRNA U34 5-methylaminomethyl-2-thiouridine-forming methyltransferase MnmC
MKGEYDNSVLKTELVISEDGSHTLFVPQLNEHYHSTHGAIQESRHIFIEAGLQKAVELNRKIKLLEVGFGTGLNALLTSLFAKRTGIEVDYIALEAYPLDKGILEQLNYCRLIEDREATMLFDRISKSEWDQSLPLSANFTLLKVHKMLQDYPFNDGPVHLVYFDAFSPDVQPELWSEGIFKKLFDHMVIGGILVTYSCKGVVKRALKSAGFLIEKLPGPPGKREILRAIKE